MIRSRSSSRGTGPSAAYARAATGSRSSASCSSIPRSPGDAARSARARRRRARRARRRLGDRVGRCSSGLRVIRPGRRSGSPRNSTAGDSGLPARTRGRTRGWPRRAPVRGGRASAVPSVSPKPGRQQRHRERGERGEDPERPDRERRPVDRADEEDPDAGAAADPVQEADRRRHRAAFCSGVLVRRGRVRVQVGVRAVAVVVRVRVEGAAAPAKEQPDGESRDQEPDRRLGASLHGLGQVAR